MTIAVTNIGTNTDTSGGSVIITVPGGGVPTGALIVVVVGDFNSTVGGSVTDTHSNTYTNATSKLFNSSFQFVSIFYAWNVTALTSGNTITFTKQHNGDTAAVSAFYATGIKTSATPYDSAVTVTSNGSSSAPSVTSGTPSASGELIIGVLGVNGTTADTFTQDTNHAWNNLPTRVSVTTSGGSPERVMLEGGYFVNSGTTALTYAPTITNKAWGSIIVGFKSSTNAFSLTASAGSFTETGKAATLRATRLFTTTVVPYTFTGIAATLIPPGNHYILTGDKLTLTLLGKDAILVGPHGIVATSTSFILTGQSITFSSTRVLTAGAGSFTELGISSSLKSARRLTADVGSYTFTGTTLTGSSTIYANVNGTWRIVFPRVKQGGIWKTVTDAYVKHNGVWNKVVNGAI